MKVLILPDVHHRWNLAEKIIKTIPHDKIISLGDWFDNFNDTVKDAEETASYLQHLLKMDNFVCLHSNHDIAYWKPHFTYLRCPGFSHEKCRVINKYITPNLWEEKFNLVYFEQGFTLSHAGFHSHSLPYYPDMNADEYNDKRHFKQKYIARACDEAFDYLMLSKIHPVLRLGDRMGERGVGGCLWMDWSNFQPIPYLNQIVGHSIGKDVRIKKDYDKHGNVISTNYCLDTNNKHVGIIENGEFNWIELEKYGIKYEK